MGEKNGEVSDESSRGTNYINSLDLESYGSDSDGDVVCRRSLHELKNDLAKYAVNKKFDIVYFRNEKGRTRARKLTKEELKVYLSKDTYRRTKTWALEEINGKELMEEMSKLLPKG
ncbi:hypothetical protein GOBAR_AA28604 [Gossypium barbadense]|uniref:Uncharacterized protein n=1 Tax=Gossypium barbadense TaxID=3634 RepID=A0A2P5WLX1_GOSBA|nr:hypothetical protein GOBAR_AA28604 [Gossypium barbadense]